MRKKMIVLAACMMATAACLAQKGDGGISAQMLSDIEKAYQGGPQSKALFNAIASNSIDDLAKNFANQGEVNTYFSHETKAQSIHDQKSSGRCWMFSGLNVLRSDFALRTDSLSVEFSHDYLFFYDQLEKANLMLQGVIDCADKPIDDTRVQFFFKSPINDGGTFCGVADLAEKYGLVPMGVQPVWPTWPRNMVLCPWVCSLRPIRPTTPAAWRASWGRNCVSSVWSCARWWPTRRNPPPSRPARPRCSAPSTACCASRWASP